MENSKINWTDHTWNPWIGCRHVSAECDHCYADTMVTNRMGRDFSIVTHTKTWKEPPKWNRKAPALEAELGRRVRVFCASLTDFFIQDADPWRDEAWDVIRQCTEMDWLILTKRPQLIPRRLPSDYRDEFILPKLSTFQEGNATQEDLNSLNRIIDDIKNRVNIPGRIEVQMLTDWESLVGHLNDNHKRNHYDVVALDYLTRLDVPNCEPRWRDRAVAGYINRAQALTRQFDGGRGIVLITPIQINRSGYQSAKKKKDGEKKHDLTSVSQHSEFYQDMDFIISLYRDEKYEGDLLIETQKVRGGKFPPNAKLRVDEYSRKVTTDSDAVTDKHWVDFLNGKVQSPVSKYVRETFIDEIFSTLDVGGKE